MADIKKALLIIDVQKGFLNEHTAHVLNAVKVLIKSQEYDHIFATRFVNTQNSPFVKWMHWSKFMEGSPDCQLAFEPKENVEVFNKNIYGALLPEVSSELVEKNIQKIHICGLDTNMCVFITAVQIFEQGLCEPFILSQACASHSGKEYHDASLMLLKKAIGKEHIL